MNQRWLTTLNPCNSGVCYFGCRQGLDAKASGKDKWWPSRGCPRSEDCIPRTSLNIWGHCFQVSAMLVCESDFSCSPGPFLSLLLYFGRFWWQESVEQTGLDTNWENLLLGIVALAPNQHTSRCLHCDSGRLPQTTSQKTILFDWWLQFDIISPPLNIMSWILLKGKAHKKWLTL